MTGRAPTTSWGGEPHKSQGRACAATAEATSRGQWRGRCPQLPRRSSGRTPIRRAARIHERAHLQRRRRAEQRKHTPRRRHAIREADAVGVRRRARARLRPPRRSQIFHFCAHARSMRHSSHSALADSSTRVSQYKTTTSLSPHSCGDSSRKSGGFTLYTRLLSQKEALPLVALLR